MSAIALLCSGQGFQGPGMFDLTASEPAAEPVFAAAAKVLGGRDPRMIARTAGDEIYRNDVAQVLCCTAALAASATLAPALGGRLIIAGYSVGELAAWGVAGAVDVPTVLELAKQRAALMDAEAGSDTGLGALVGLSREMVEALCGAYRLHIAIINGPAHFVIGGATADVDAALAEATRRGASRAVHLRVGIASHTPVLNEAAAHFTRLLHQRLGDRPPVQQRIRLIDGVGGALVRNIGNGLERLGAQLATTVDWYACMDACHAARPARILELGPGDQLARIASDIVPDVKAKAMSNFGSISGVMRWLADA